MESTFKAKRWHLMSVGDKSTEKHTCSRKGKLACTAGFLLQAPVVAVRSPAYGVVLPTFEADADHL